MEILNTSWRRWGEETYASEKEAMRALKDFWKGVSGVNLKKFHIVPEDHEEFTR